MDITVDGLRAKKRSEGTIRAPTTISVHDRSNDGLRELAGGYSALARVSPLAAILTAIPMIPACFGTAVVASRRRRIGRPMSLLRMTCTFGTMIS